MSTHTPTTTELPDNSPDPISTESSLSNWAGDYVTGLLGQGQALTQMPYEGYQGDLTAGANQTQTDAFAGIAGLTLPEQYGTAMTQAGSSYTNANTLGDYDTGTNMWNNEAAGQYMSPYIQQALDPQLLEIQRQNEIQRMSDNDALTKAGAYGGGRQAIMNSEQNDNTARLMSEVTGKGYQDAYNSAADMFTSDQNRYEQSRQFGADLGLQGNRQAMDATNQLTDIAQTQLNSQRDIYGDQLAAGDMERGITSEGLAADYGQFVEERDYPYKQIQWGMGLLNGMPLETQNTNYSQDSTLSQYLQNSAGGGDLLSSLLGIFGDSGGGGGGASDGYTTDPNAPFGVDDSTLGTT